MSINKLDIKFNNPVMDSENIEKIADKVNEVIDEKPDITPNPTSSATEILQKIQIDDTIYSISAGSTVIANPTGTATQLIDKIQIDTTIYDFPPKVSAESGETTELTLKQLAIGTNVYNVYKPLYHHKLRFTPAGGDAVWLNIFNNDETPITTVDKVIEYFSGQGYTTQSEIEITGAFKTNNVMNSAFYARFTIGTTPQMYVYDIAGNNVRVFNCTDKVMTLI